MRESLILDCELVLLTVEVQYEYMPEFCSHYGMIGHSPRNCHFLERKKEQMDNFKQTEQPKSKQFWYPKQVYEVSISQDNVQNAMLKIIDVDMVTVTVEQEDQRDQENVGVSVEDVSSQEKVQYEKLVQVEAEASASLVVLETPDKGKSVQSVDNVMAPELEEPGYALVSSSLTDQVNR